MKKRTIFIWDIHGCFDEFELLLDKLKITDKDIVYIVWDMINKWPKSWKVIKFLYKNQNQFRCILWNNEINLFRYLEDSNYSSFIADDSKKIFDKLKSKFQKYPEILDYLKKLPLYIKDKDFLVIHWWLNPSKKLEEQSVDELTRIREINNKPWYEQYKWNKTVIYGHWAINGLNIYNNTIWLDWWCVYGRSLHAYILETWEIYTQQALKCYQDVFIKD